MRFTFKYAAIVGMFAAMGCAEDDSDLASVRFCHAIWKDAQTIELTAVVDEGDSKTVFKASTECCTPCAGVTSGKETKVVLYEDDKEIYTTTTTFKKRNDYILLATVYEGSTAPSLGLSDLTKANSECATHLPAGWNQCGTSHMNIVSELDGHWDVTKEIEGDPDAGCQPPIKQR